jgi:hypothetical protein
MKISPIDGKIIFKNKQRLFDILCCDILCKIYSKTYNKPEIGSSNSGILYEGI